MTRIEIKQAKAGSGEFTKCNDCPLVPGQLLNRGLRKLTGSYSLQGIGDNFANRQDLLFPLRSTSQISAEERVPSKAINLRTGLKPTRTRPPGRKGHPAPTEPQPAPARLSAGRRSPLSRPSARPRTLERARGSERGQAERAKEQGTRLSRDRHPSDASGKETGTRTYLGRLRPAGANLAPARGRHGRSPPRHQALQAGPPTLRVRSS